MKRCVLCTSLVLWFLILCCFPSYAVHELDGVAGRFEYSEPSVQLISHRIESNNNVSSAYLFYDISEQDYSVYIAVKYVCDDVGILLDQMAEKTEESLAPFASAVEVSVQNEVVFTAYGDGTLSQWDRDRFDAESCVSFVPDKTRNPETNNFAVELRLGMKYGIPYDTILGIRILDCTGEPSNYYTINIRPTPPETETEAETTMHTSTKSTSTVQTKTTALATSSKAAPNTTRRLITAAVAAVRGKTTVAETAATKATEVFTTKKAAVKKNASAAKKLKTTRAATQAESASSRTTAAELTAVLSTDTTKSSTPAITAEKAIRINRTRTIGIVFAAILLTIAVMTSVFIGISNKRRSEAKPFAESTDSPNKSEPPKNEGF